MPEGRILSFPSPLVHQLCYFCLGLLASAGQQRELRHCPVAFHGVKFAGMLPGMGLGNASWYSPTHPNLMSVVLGLEWCKHSS